MKAFWSLILALVVITAAVFALRPGPGPRRPDAGVAAETRPGSSALNPEGQRARPAPNAGAGSGPTGEPPAGGSVMASPAATAPAMPSGAARGTPPASPLGTLPDASPITEASPVTLPDHPAIALSHVSDPSTVSDWLDGMLAVRHAHAVTIRAAASDEDEARDALADAPPLPVAPGAASAIDPDDPNTLGGRFALRGQGTASDPFRLPWEALVAVRETYRPRTGHTELPAWLDRIDGKYIALTGYLLLPLVQESSDEVLLMRNQWDGCCIGVPPTPYDAIEVKLNAPLAGHSSWRMNYGTITGKITVDPYIASGWLIGLYLMDDATLVDAGL